MPPWAVSVPRLTRLFGRNAVDRLFHRRWCRVGDQLRLPSHLSRSASTHVSPTAINYRPNIPPRNKELYESLSELNGAAEAYVNISRLQLSLRGLAAQDAVTRVAVLSLNSQRSAQKLARLLFADPLGEEQSWERELQQSDEDGTAVLLRYGEEWDSYPPSPLYRVLSVPSKLLRTHNLEILVSILNVNKASTPVKSTSESSAEGVLIPKLQASASRGLPVPFPVHKTLVLGEGIESALAYGRYDKDDTRITAEVVKVAIDLPPRSSEIVAGEQGTSSVVNVDVGEEALASFRESIANSEKFERGWFRSGLPNLTRWLVDGLEPAQPIKPVAKALITSIADEVEENITKEDIQHRNEGVAANMQHQVSGPILTHLESWAEQSHTELRDQLDEAFMARNWHKLAWWKLFWRVDDVTMITNEILERRWLVDAEKAAVYLAGRMDQAGFPDTIPHYTVPSGQEKLETSQDPPQVSPSSNLSNFTSETRLDISTEVRERTPWPTQISSSRTSLLKHTVPPLQALAQRLVLTTLSTTSLSSALSVLLYVSVSTVSVFEASAITALGLVYSLRRMQNLWESARFAWQSQVREEGRMTLKQTEDMVRLIVKNSEKSAIQDERVMERQRARKAVARVREALRKM